MLGVDLLQIAVKNSAHLTGCSKCFENEDVNRSDIGAVDRILKAGLQSTVLMY